MYSNKKFQHLSIKQVPQLLGFHPETIKRWARHRENRDPTSGPLWAYPGQMAFRIDSFLDKKQ